MKIAQLSVLAVLALAAQGAFAQSNTASDSRSRGSSSSSSSGSAQGSSGGGAATDGSTVTNAGSLLASDTPVDDGTTPTAGDISAPKGEMANTGGEPELMLLAGVLLASGGLLLRRKVGAQSL